MSAQICKKIPKNQNGAAMPGKPSAFLHYNVPVGEKGSKLKKKVGAVVQTPMPRKKIVEQNPATISYPVNRATTINKKQAGGRIRPTLTIGDAGLKYSNKEIYNKINPEVAYDVPGFLDAGIRYAVAPGGKPRTGKNLASIEEEAYWKKYLTGENTKGVVEPTTNRINYDKGDTTSEFVGVPSSMMERVAAMADTLSLGKLVRDPGMYKKAFPEGNMTPKDLKENYEFAKKVMNNPGVGQRANERMTLKEGVKPYTSGLGALQNFGMVWDKNKGVVKAYDTYNFPPELSLWLPGRKHELKLRGEIPFNPKVGSTLLKNNFEQYDTIK